MTFSWETFCHEVNQRFGGNNLLYSSESYTLWVRTVGSIYIQITKAPSDASELPPMEEYQRVSTFKFTFEDISSFVNILETEKDISLTNIENISQLKRYRIIAYISLLSDYEIEGEYIIQSTMIEECRELILEMCKDGMVTSNQINEEAKNRWPNHPRWEAREKNGEKKLIHDINNARTNLLEIGEICNPEISKYCLVNDSDFVDLSEEGDLWSRVSLKLLQAALSKEVCSSRDQKSFFEFTFHENKPKIINKYNSMKIVTERQFDLIIKKLQLCGGIMERPFKNEAELAALVYCCDLLSFKNGFVYLTKNNTTIDIDEKNNTTIRDLFNRSKNRANGKSGTYNRYGKKIPFELDEKWISEKEKITNCEITGIPFSDSPGPFARSFDQRSAGKGYTPENVDVVVRIYNYAKNVYDIEDVESFCRQYVTHMEQR